MNLPLRFVPLIEPIVQHGQREASMEGASLVHTLREVALMGALVGSGLPPQQAIEMVEAMEPQLIGPSPAGEYEKPWTMGKGWPGMAKGGMMGKGGMGKPWPGGMGWSGMGKPWPGSMGGWPGGMGWPGMGKPWPGSMGGWPGGMGEWPGTGHGGWAGMEPGGSPGMESTN